MSVKIWLLSQFHGIISNKAIMDASKDYNSLWSSHWGQVQEFGPTHAHVRRLLLSLLRGKEFSTVLDVGCGNGVNMRFFLDRLPGIGRMNGCDVSEVALQSARKRCPEATLHCLDIQKQAIDERFDLVYSSDVLEHLEDDGAAIGNMFMMASRFLLVSTLQGRMRNFEKKIGHVRNYRPGELEKKITDKGFTIEKKIEWGWPFFSPCYRNLLDSGAMNDRTSSGSMWIRRSAAFLLYALFTLNVEWKGDSILILARKERSKALLA
jgi:2-polyprenyl-3-methyl-5-hydroxy-6-metoxy-1,4-benzoquinol methylase